MRNLKRNLLALTFLAGLLLLGLLSLLKSTGPSGLPPGGDFTLQSADGPLALHDLRGKVVLIFFGYTYCPDACPTALVSQAAAFQKLTPEEQESVAGLFVSVDPERDTPVHLKEYARFFHPQFIGVTGASAEVQAVAHRFGVFYARQAADGSGHYSVDHSSETYVIAKDGRLVARLPYGTSPEAILVELRRELH